MSFPSARQISAVLTACTLGVARPAAAQIRQVSETAATAPAGRYLIVYRNGQVPADAASDVIHAGAKVTGRNDLLGLSVVENVSDSARAALAAQPGISYIVPDILVRAHALTVGRAAVPGLITTPDPLYHSAQGWAVQQVGGFGTDGTSAPARGPWNVTKGARVRIAILDSGVDPRHPDIAPNLALNLSEVARTALPSACDDGSPSDQQGHGTWTASLAAGALGPGTGLVAGVAPSASILNIKVLQRMPAARTPADPTGCLNGQASGLLSWIVKGIEDAIINRADIISMSLGVIVDVSTGDGAGQRAIFDRATLAASNAGIVLIAAAGNDGYNLANKRYMELPAQSRNVLAIVASTNPACSQNLKTGATCVAGSLALPYYSNYGAPLNALSAPGGSYPVQGTLSPGATPLTSATVLPATGWITGACSSGKPSTLSGLPSDAAHSLGCFNLGHTAYVQAMGTSASAPLVAGAAALLRSAHPTWTASTIIQTLRSSAAPTPTLPFPLVSVTKLLTPAK